MRVAQSGRRRRPVSSRRPRAQDRSQPSAAPATGARRRRTMARWASTWAAALGERLAVHVRWQQRLDLATLGHSMRLGGSPGSYVSLRRCPIISNALHARRRVPARSRSCSCRRPREMRDITVPIGIARASAISWYERLFDVAQPDRVAELFGQRIQRRLQFRAEAGPQQQGFRALRADAAVQRGALIGVARPRRSRTPPGSEPDRGAGCARCYAGS